MLKVRTNEISCRSILSSLNALQLSPSEGAVKGNKAGVREMNGYLSNNASNDERSFTFRDYPHNPFVFEGAMFYSIRV